MKKLPSAILATLLLTHVAFAQQGPKGRGNFEVSPLAIGEAGIAWYTSYETGLAEAQRSNRPIMFMAAATQCSGIPGTFCQGYTATQNGLFSDKEFIELSRRFVCKCYSSLSLLKTF